MKALGSFIIVAFVLCVCFVKCTSDRTKIKIYTAADAFIKGQIHECEERLEQDSTLMVNDYKGGKRKPRGASFNKE